MFRVVDALVEETRFRLVGARQADVQGDLAADVRAGLTATPKLLYARHFYDAEGSRLFEEICRLPEYYLTRAEAQILGAMAGELVEVFREEPELVELGSGSALKTKTLIRAFLGAYGKLRFVPIDISTEMLEQSSRELVDGFDGLVVDAIASEYLGGLRELTRMDREEHRTSPRLVLWLGSSIGNLGRQQAKDFLHDIHDVVERRDRMLIGLDRRKDAAVLEAAYDDAAGVTAEFNRNILRRINRELGADFDVERFDHRAIYREEEGRVEMHLVSQDDVTVNVSALGLRVDFTAGETIHTESSYKYSDAEIEALAEASEFRIERHWMDEARRFSLVLFRR